MLLYCIAVQLRQATRPARSQPSRATSSSAACIWRRTPRNSRLWSPTRCLLCVPRTRCGRRSGPTETTQDHKVRQRHLCSKQGVAAAPRASSSQRDSRTLLLLWQRPVRSCAAAPPHAEAAACPLELPCRRHLLFSPQVHRSVCRQPGAGRDDDGAQTGDAARVATGCASNGRALHLVEEVLAHAQMRHADKRPRPVEAPESDDQHQYFHLVEKRRRPSTCIDDVAGHRVMELRPRCVLDLPGPPGVATGTPRRAGPMGLSKRAPPALMLVSGVRAGVEGASRAHPPCSVHTLLSPAQLPHGAPRSRPLLAVQAERYPVRRDRRRVRRMVSAGWRAETPLS